jgi:hypothetical protein
LDSDTLDGKNAADFADGVNGEAVSVADNVVTTAKIADNAVTSAKIVANAITSTELVDAAVTSSKIASNSIDGSHLATGYVSVPGAAFNVSSPTTSTLCEPNFSSTADQFYFRAGGQHCYAVAPVHLPQGVNLTSFACYVVDNSENMAIPNISFRYKKPALDNNTTPGLENPLPFVSIGGTTLADVIGLVERSSTITGEVVDNSSKVYYIRIQMSTDGVLPNLGPLLAINGCIIGYNEP